MDLTKYGPWALIVGGSEGIGAEFARALVADGFGLVLVARKQEPLLALQAELESEGATVRVLSVDLAKDNALHQVRSVTEDIEIGLLIYNAGANSVRGNFVELDAAVTEAVLMVNTWTLSAFVRHFGALMRTRLRGGMILCGSSSSYLGAPSLAAYTASKAYSRVFAEARWAEMQPFGVDVLHLLVNFTATPAMERLGINLAAAMPSAQVAAEGLAAISNGPLYIVGGERALEIVEQRSVVRGRAEVVRRFATPQRAAIVKE